MVMGKSKIITVLAVSITDLSTTYSFDADSNVACLGVLSLCQVRLVRIRTFDDLKHLENLSITVNALTAAGDLVLALSLTWLLLRSRTGFRKSDTMIKKLILARPNTFIYICFFFNIGRFYTNSLLATLNVRQSIRNAGDACGGVNATGQMDFNMKMSVLKNDTSFGSINGQRRPDISIKVDTTKELITDASIRTPSPTKSSADCDGIFSDGQSGFDSSEDIDTSTRGYGHGHRPLVPFAPASASTSVLDHISLAPSVISSFPSPPTYTNTPPGPPGYGPSRSSATPRPQPRVTAGGSRVVLSAARSLPASGYI
ncbi:hypothetical protein D9758_008251 [Tetrapyrgos nigripes]|uniref:DUF6534 domain-containing protein n=1 Tax=Tetrapyrgos nigripes TaxID=182062 RepID=A0A8H5G1K5_9AGAR|nr:hypothetical protein D9758_008251 [Tetrapyrgos nigripes]